MLVRGYAPACTKPNGFVQKGYPPPRCVLNDGEYLAEIEDVFTFTNSHGDRLGVSYKLIAGPFAGAVLLQSTTFNAAHGGRMASLLRELLAREPTADELERGPAPERLRGVRCQVLAATKATRSGTRYTYVEAATRA